MWRAAWRRHWTEPASCSAATTWCRASRGGCGSASPSRRALLHDPRLLLLDEPFTGLDDASVAALVARLRELRGAGLILVVVTHDLDVAEQLLDKVAVLKEGRLVAFDDAHGKIREHYRAHVTEPRS